MRRLLILSILCLGFAAGPAQALFSLLGVKNSMVEFLLDQISTEGVFEITVDEVEEPEDGVTAIRGLKIADAGGVWFTAESLDFSWNPSRLLQGEVEFSNLAMSDIAVLRQPVMPEGDPDAAPEAPADTPDDGARFQWPRSPLALRIDRLALTRVAIAEAVLGHAIAFDAEGAARDEGDIQSARLAVRRTDAITGTIDFDYARDFSTNTLALNLAAAEAPGGLVATLADLPKDAPTEVTLRADGPPTDWRATFDLALADMLWADGQAAISYEGPLKVDAAFSARPGAQLPQDIANLLGTEAEIIAKAAEGPDGTILIEQGQITSPDLRLTASGTFNRNTLASDLAVDLAAEAGLAAPFDGVDFGGLTFVGRVVGAPGDIAADGDLVLAGVATAPADVERAELSVDVRQSGPDDTPTTELSIAGLTRGLRLDKIAAGVIGDADVELVATLTGQDVALETLWLDSNVLRLSASGVANLDTQDFDLGYGISAPDMGPVAGAYGVEATGTIDLTGAAQQTGGVLTATMNSALSAFRHPLAEAAQLDHQGQVRLDPGTEGTPDTITFEMTGTGEGLRIDRIGPEVLATVTMDGAGTLAGDDLTLSQARLLSQPLSVIASGQLNLDTLIGALDYDVQAPATERVASLYDVPVGGVLSARGRATLGGKQTEPVVAGNLTMTGLVWDGTRYGDVTLGHDVTASASPKGDLDLTVRGSPFGPVDVKTGFALEQPVLTVTGLTASALGIAASGDLRASLDGPFATGDLAFNARDLRAAGRFAGTPLSGSLKGTARLTAPNGRQSVALRATGSGIATEGVRIDALDLDAAVANALGTPSVKADLGLASVTAGSIALERTDLTAGGPLSALNLTVTTQGTLDRKPLTATTTARANLSGPTLRATVNRLEAALDADAVSLNQPMQITSRAGTVAVRGMDLSLPDGGSLIGDVTSYGGPLGADVTISLPSLAFLKRLADVPIASGAIDATASFDTRRGTGGANIAGRNLVFEDVDTGSGLGLDTTLTLAGRRAEIAAQVSGNFGEPLRITANVPLTGGTPGLATRGPVQATVDWTGEIGDLWALVPAAGHVLTGQTTIDLGIGGDISAPEITGGVRVREGGYQNTDFGTILTGLTLDTTLAQGGDLGLSLRANDGAAGTIAVDGTVALDASGIDIRTKIGSAVLARRDDIKARIGGTIDVKGAATALTVGGKLTVEDAEVRLINNNPPGIVTLGDVIIKGAPEPEPDDDASSVTLNIDVDAPGRIFVRGRGLDSQWGMALAIRGDAAAPDIRGTIERQRGQLSLIGKTFDLARGKISFDGGRTIDPRIDVMLERTDNNFTGRIVVDGTASDPQLSFTSTPALPEDEVLPRTLFGKSSQALTASQAIQLGIGIATLLDGGDGALGSVRGAIGVDSLDVEQDADGNASVAAGKQVTEEIWVGTKQSLGEGGTSVVVEIDVFEDIQLEAEVDDGGSSSVGVQWQTDF
ncbi:MAG: translocation/assembly module TamB domain-containing protein [Pseudomonadota bacterium]